MLVKWKRRTTWIVLTSQTMEQVEKATHEQLAPWYRFLPSGDTKEQQKIQDRIAERFKELGGMNPALSKKIGF
jgi:hypothetical protein